MVLVLSYPLTHPTFELLATSSTSVTGIPIVPVFTFGLRQSFDCWIAPPWVTHHITSHHITTTYTLSPYPEHSLIGLIIILLHTHVILIHSLIHFHNTPTNILTHNIPTHLIRCKRWAGKSGSPPWSSSACSGYPMHQVLQCTRHSVLSLCHSILT